VTGQISGAAIRWREDIEATGDVLARFGDGMPALTRKEKIHYLACWPDESLLAATMSLVLDAADIPTFELPEHVRMRRRGELVFAFNYGAEDWTVPTGIRIVLGERTIRPYEVAVWRA
jgi:beta-galactosidase